MKKIVIGITGGIGSGKSTVTQILSENGYKAVIADDIAKELMISDQSIINRITSHFGKKSYENGKLNNKYLSEKVFNDSNQLKKINSIVHPPTIKKIESIISDEKTKNNLIFVESALIFEAKMEYLFDYILLVTADEDIRIERTVKRGVETQSEVKRRISNQIPESEKRKRSQFIIENNSSLNDLREKTIFFISLFKSLTL